MNTVNLIGNLTRDPERFETAKGTTVCRIRLAVDEMAKGKDEAGYIDVASFGPSGEACLERLQKGSRVGVSGRLNYREWEAEDGSKRTAISVIGHVQFLDRLKGNGDAEPADYAPDAGKNAADEDIPF